MSTSVLEALQNAKINFATVGRLSQADAHPIFHIAMEQLSNGIAALENDKEANDIIQENLSSDVDVGNSE